MYVTKYKDKYRAFERYKVGDTWRKVSVVMDRDTPQARRKALQVLAGKIPVCESEITFAALCKRYTADQATHLKAVTVFKNESLLNIICKTMGKRKVSTLTSGQIRNDLLQLTTKPVTLNFYLKRVKAVIRWAYQNSYIASTDCVDKIAKWEVKKKKQELKCLEREELKAVIDAASDYYAPMIEFLALSGLRFGELTALDNADVTRQTITVSKTFDRVTQTNTDPKTEDSNRVIDVQPELWSCIKRLKRIMDIYRFSSGKRNDYFVVSPNGDRLKYGTFRAYFVNLTEKTIGRKLSPHSLRHTHASLLAEEGIPLETISRRLGHSDSEITKEIYLHVTQRIENYDRELLKKVSFF